MEIMHVKRPKAHNGIHDIRLDNAPTSLEKSPGEAKKVY
jgi:hypothetical protein